MAHWLEGDKATRVLGLDISTNSVAWCLNTKDGIKHFGELTFSGATVFERIADAQNKIRDEFPDLDYDLLLFESAVYIQNKHTVILLAYAYGAVIGALMKPGVRVEEISPLVWQPAIGNKALTKEEKAAVQNQYPDKSKAWYSNKYREIRKERTRKWASHTFGLNAGTDNQSDAIAISQVGVDTYC